MVVQELGISLETIEEVAQQERMEIERRERAYRDGRAPARVEGRTAILIDDGLATGSSMMAAARSLRSRARQAIVAVPVVRKARATNSAGKWTRSSARQLRSYSSPLACSTAILHRQQTRKSALCSRRRGAMKARERHRREDAITEHSERN